MTMLGAIIGDIAGSVYEWNNIKTKDFPLLERRCFFTDDTVMTVAIAEGIEKGGDKDDFVSSMKKLGRLYPKAGYGGRFGSWLFSHDTAPYGSFGNGSAMRVSPVAWAYDSIGQVEEKAGLSAEVTHSHPEGIKGAQATAACIYLARTGSSKDTIREYVVRRYGYDLSRSLSEIRPSYRFNETCQETVPQAITAFLESTSFEDAIRNAISLGGDSDTLAAITGSIAEAAYGIPVELEERAFTFLDDRLGEIVRRFREEYVRKSGSNNLFV